MAVNNDNDANEITIFTIGSKVEISSDEPGFDGAWYVVTLLDVNVHNPKTNNDNGVLVKYDTLFEDDDLNEKLMEIVDSKYLRPLPPPEYNGGDGFEVGDVIDAYYRDGWWIGVVVEKVMKDNDEEDDKYVVCFKNPYEEVEFDKFQLRIPVDWIDSCWKILPKKMHKKLIKTPKKRISDSKNAAQTSDGKRPGDLDHTSSHFTEKRTRLRQRAETSNSEQIGAADGSVTNSRVRTEDSNLRGETSRSSTPGSKRTKKYTVPFTETNGSGSVNQDLPLVEYGVITTKLKSAAKKDAQTSECNDDAQLGFVAPSKGPSDLDHIVSSKKRTRSHKIAETRNSAQIGAVDGCVTYSRNRTTNSNSNSNSHGARSRSSTPVANLGSKGSKKVTGSVMETCGSPANNQDLPLVEYGAMTMETSEADDGTSQKRKRGGPHKLLVNRNDLQKGTQETRRYELREMTSHPDSVLKRCLSNSPCNQRDESSGPQNQTNGETDDYQQQWPFIKQSPFWATIESMESYKITPQKPHFTPLKESKQLLREGFAIGFASTFADLVRRVKCLQLNDPNELINDSLEVLVELESHGFDVQLVRDRLNALLTWKVKVGQLQDKLDKIKKDIEKCNLDRSVVEEETGQYEEEISQLEAKIRELKRKVVQNSKTLSIKDEEINKMQVNVDRVSNQIMDWKIGFEKLAASPFTATSS